jgi:hypothetical protein
MITAESRGLEERKIAVWIIRAISYLVYFWLIIVEVILIIGFFLLLFGANPTAGFTQWAYRNLDRVMAPFRGIFTPIELGTTANDVQAVFETSVLFAMIVYGIVALALGALIGWLSDRLDRIERAQHQRELEGLRRLEAEQRLADAAGAGAPVPPSSVPSPLTQGAAPVPPPPVAPPPR